MIDARPRAPRLVRDARLALTGVLLLLAALGSSGLAWAADEVSSFEQQPPLYVVVGTGGEGLLLREGPGPQHEVIGVLPEGSSVNLVSGPLPGPDGSVDWYEVELGGAGTLGGFASSLFLAESGGILSEGAAQTLPALMALPPGSRVYSEAIVTGYANGADGGAVGSITASGTRTRWGVVAADRALFPFGTRLLIEGFDDTVFVVEDTGSGVKGLIFDVWFPDVPTAIRFGTQRRTVTVLPPGS